MLGKKMTDRGLSADASLDIVEEMREDIYEMLEDGSSLTDFVDYWIGIDYERLYKTSGDKRR